MPPERRAVIDVGTNSVKLLVAEVTGPVVVPLLEQATQTRLGSGFYETHRLAPEAIDRTARTIADFAAEAARWTPRPPRIIATSAARDATNAADLLAAVRRACGLDVEIIPGDQEADWAFQGVATDPALHGPPLLIVDAGGGSTEFIVGRGEHAQFRRSFRLGTIRLLETLRPADPPTMEDWARCQQQLREIFDREILPGVRPALASLPGQTGAQLVGTSGTTSILARMAKGLRQFDRQQIEATRLTRAWLRQEREELWRLPLAARKQLTGLPADRADVILMGAAIYEAVMEAFDLPDLRVSTRGLRYAALMDPIPSPG